MKSRYGIILVSIFFGLLVWVIDAGFDYYIFYEAGFWDLLILDVPAHELYIRTAFLLCFVAFGVFASYTVARRRRAEKGRLDSEKRFRSIAETANDAIISADSEAKIVFWNNGAERVFGYSAEEIIGEPITVIMPERYRHAALKGYRRVVETGKSRVGGHPVEVYGLNKNGRELPVELSLARWDTKDGVFFTSIIRDITERKESEEERAQLMVQLEDKNKELQHFTSIVRHDIGNNLLSIQAFSEVLGNSSGQVSQLVKEVKGNEKVMEQILSLVDSKMRESAGYIQDSAAQIAKLLEGLRRLSVVGRIELNIERLDMNQVIEQITGKMKPQIDSRGASVSVDELPGCMGDAGQIDQVFSNLLNNAIKYLNPEQSGMIRIFGRVEEGDAIYGVEDNGVGIPGEQLDKVFDIFHRAHSREEGGGEGLGLSIVARILERHSGQVGVESEPNKGSTFYVTLPAG
ncbi:MAG: sensor histidine kinase [Planctomycetota bacterium]|jgi:PAS domain S-box-containing protein